MNFKHNNFFKIALLPSIALLILGWASYLLENKAITLTIMLVVTPLIGMIQGIFISSKYNHYIFKLLGVLSLTLFLIIRKFLTLYWISLIITLLFAITGFIFKEYILFVKANINNLLDKNIKKEETLFFIKKLTLIIICIVFIISFYIATIIIGLIYK